MYCGVRNETNSVEVILESVHIFSSAPWKFCVYFGHELSL
jgi:hypothetical protein